VLSQPDLEVIQREVLSDISSLKAGLEGTTLTNQVCDTFHYRFQLGRALTTVFNWGGLSPPFSIGEGSQHRFQLGEFEAKTTLAPFFIKMYTLNA
jgi:hypothetical protein